MASCTDRQLAQSIRESAFSQTRGGVARALRPFSGQATPENLADYLNRELFPVVTQARSKLNEVYLQVADNAPSANPLVYLFSESTVNADPTTGFLRLDASPEENATTIRVSQTNKLLTDVAAWLDVMQGSATTPLGVVTLTHSLTPSRYLRFDLNSMVDQGAYWDLAVTIVESSHPNPFVADDPVLVGFIPGVAAAGAVPIPPVASLRQIAIISHIGGNDASSVSRLAFSDANNITFSLSTAANAATLLASAVVASTQASIRISAGTTSVLSSAFTFSNSNRLTFGINAAGVITGSRDLEIGVISGAFGAQAFVTRLAFSNNTNITVTATLGVGAATVGYSISTLNFSNSNNVTFGIAGSTLTASASAAATRELGIVSHIGGNVVSSVSQLAFSNASNVTFSLSTAAGAATLIASVAAGGGGITAFALSNAASSVMATGLTFNNANGFSFLLSTAAGNAATLSGSFQAPTTQASIRISAGTTSILSSGFTFTDSHNISWTMNNGTLAASATVASTQASIRISAGTTSILSSAFTFSNSNNVSFGINNGTITGSVNQDIGQIVLPATAVSSATALGILNSPTITWSATSAVGGITIQPNAFGPIVSHVGGNSISNVTRLAFSNASNVTFSLSTAAGAATVLASVAAGGGGIALADLYGNTATSGTLVFTGNPNSTITDLWSANSVSNNIAFRISNQSITAAAWMGFNDATGGNATVASRMNMLASNGVTFGLATGNDSVAARMVNITASYAPPAISHWANRWHLDGDVFQLVPVTGNSSFYIMPLNQDGDPFPAPMTVGTVDILLNGSSASAAFGMTYRGGIYTQVNSTQISLLNSFSNVLSFSTTQNATSRSDSYDGCRWMSVHSSQWSSQPVMSPGVQYWYGFAVSTSGASVITAWMGMQCRQIPSFKGRFQIAQSNTQGSAFGPFWGIVSSGAPPANISVSQILNGISVGTVANIPCLHFRTNILF